MYDLRTVISYHFTSTKTEVLWGKTPDGDMLRDWVKDLVTKRE